MLKETNLKMIKNWQEEFNVALKCDLSGDLVTTLQHKEVGIKC